MPPVHTEGRSCPCKKLPWSLSSFTAAEFGEVQSLLKKDQFWNRRDDAGYTPLHLAAQHNHVAATSLLIRSGANVNGYNGEENLSGVDGGVKRRSATPLHRAAFAGAIASMQLLLQEPDCDLLARDNSFGDGKTALHKAAAGGRYLAVQLLLDELNRRALLSSALRIEDSSSRTPLEVAQDLLCRQDTERKSVARWDVVAGGVADWSKCTVLLERANTSCDNGMSGGSVPQREVALPPLPDHLASIQGCLDCDLSLEGTCLTSIWQAAFQAALGSVVNESLSTSSSSISRQVQTQLAPNELNCKIDSALDARSKSMATINPQNVGGVACRVCGKNTVSLYRSRQGFLVCKQCFRRS